MKRLGRLYDRLCSYENLLLAFGKVQRGKRFRPEVQDFAANLPENLNCLARELAEGNFRLGDYHSFEVFEPKRRKIYAAAVRERVIHHAVINICGERLERSLIDDSYACIRSRGHLPCVRRAQDFARHHEWCLKLDIHGYFDHIDHEILFAALARKFKEPQLLALFSALLASYRTAPGKGLPIGNLTSQYFANLYLDPFDRWVGNSRRRCYLRYMDDMLVFGEHDDLKRLWREAPQFLADHLRLELKHGGSLHRLSQGVDFLGYRLFPNCLLLNHRSRLRFKRGVKKLNESLSKGKLSPTTAAQRRKALESFIDHADTYHFKQKTLSQVNSCF